MALDHQVASYRASCAAEAAGTRKVDSAGTVAAAHSMVVALVGSRLRPIVGARSTSRRKTCCENRQEIILGC